MELKNLNIEQLVELRTQMILEKKNLSEINILIDQKEEEYSMYLIEDESSSGVYSGGVSMANASIPGVGPVLSAQPSNLSGSTIGNDWSSGGGTIGSGDVNFPYNASGGNIMNQKVPVKEMGKNHGAMTGKKTREKKLNLKTIKNLFAKRQDFTAGEGGAPRAKKVMNFDDFQKNDLTKVTKIKDI